MRYTDFKSVAAVLLLAIYFARVDRLRERIGKTTGHTTGSRYDNRAIVVHTTGSMYDNRAIVVHTTGSMYDNQPLYAATFGVPFV